MSSSSPMRLKYWARGGEAHCAEAAACHQGRSKGEGGKTMGGLFGSVSSLDPEKQSVYPVYTHFSGYTHIPVYTHSRIVDKFLHFRAQNFFATSFGPTLMAHGSFSAVRLAAARPPSACPPSPTGDVEIQGESCRRQKVQKRCSWNAKLNGLYITLFVVISCSSGDLAVDTYSQTAVAS